MAGEVREAGETETAVAAGTADEVNAAGTADEVSAAGTAGTAGEAGEQEFRERDVAALVAARTAIAGVYVFCNSMLASVRESTRRIAG